MGSVLWGVEALRELAVVGEGGWGSVGISMGRWGGGGDEVVLFLDVGGLIGGADYRGLAPVRIVPWKFLPRVAF